MSKEKIINPILKSYTRRICCRSSYIHMTYTSHKRQKWFPMFRHSGIGLRICLKKIQVRKKWFL
jgi:hypothetical protein